MIRTGCKEMEEIHMQTMQELRRIQEIHQSILKRRIHFIHERLDPIREEMNRKNALPVFPQHYTVVFQNHYTVKSLKSMRLGNYDIKGQQCIRTVSPRCFLSDGSSCQVVNIDFLAPVDIDYTETYLYPIHGLLAL